DAWLLALDRFGTMSFGEVAADAIAICERGFVLYDLLARAINAKAAKLAGWPGSAAVFTPNGRPLQEGEVVFQRDLGRTLRRLAEAEAGAWGPNPRPPSLKGKGEKPVFARPVCRPPATCSIGAGSRGSGRASAGRMAG